MKRFFALSRTTHGILDIAAPGFCALLCLGNFPPWQIILISLFTAFAAYTAIYALNDLVGITVDREKFVGGINAGYSVEASDMRYPLAQNVLSNRDGWLWFTGWFALALIGSYLLNPVIVIILVAAALLEVVYCLLFDVTYLRTLVSGLVKSCGPIAAVFVVNPNPSPYLLMLIFAWIFFWEIGGQNVPADWNDTVEDKRVNAKTIPIHFGTKSSGADCRYRVGAYGNYRLTPANDFPARFRLALFIGKRRCGIHSTVETGLSAVSTSGRMSGCDIV